MATTLPNMFYLPILRRLQFMRLGLVQLLKYLTLIRNLNESGPLRCFDNHSQLTHILQEHQARASQETCSLCTESRRR
jgi:hypothetical protein